MLFTFTQRIFNLKKGTTRYVFLFKNHVVKIPALYNWRSFLRGMLCNYQENSFSKLNAPELCPVKFYMPLGLFIIMPRAEELTSIKEYPQNSIKGFTIPAENKLSSWGKLNGKIVAIDYGE